MVMVTHLSSWLLEIVRPGSLELLPGWKAGCDFSVCSLVRSTNCRGRCSIKLGKYMYEISR